MVDSDALLALPIAGELLQRETGAQLIHVPFRSTVNSLSDLVGGHIDAIFGDVAILKPQVEAMVRPAGGDGSGWQVRVVVACLSGRRRPWETWC